ncbi:alpha/beta hydrolase [Mesorhizobium sp. WSM3879]|uniref:alpha/beta fold hydrolase n=1 Tax=Mesorhizobium sp. WSM3879 TaxID=2029406 RepID=UPI001FDFCC6B|nr:alpha/beta hydrolase [Mesorhizobium sp. WSM3879]
MGELRPSDNGVIPGAARRRNQYAPLVALQQRYIFPYLDRLQSETLIIWSKDDPTVTPEQGLKLARLIRNSDFHLLHNAAHAIHIDQSEAVNPPFCSTANF